MKKITIVKPRQTRTVSMTDGCFLNCMHCQGHFLKSMDKDIDYSAESFLLSGGCDEKGAVPINISLLKDLKRNNKKINIHTGLIDEETVSEISKYVDVVSFDFITDNDVIKNTYNLNKTEDDFINSYLILKEYCRVVPHVMIGLGNEKRSIDKLKELNEQEVSFIILCKHPKIRNDLKEPRTDQIENVLIYARKVFKTIHLGCMRPLKRKKEIDEMAINYVDSIVNPHRDLKLSDYEITIKRECCSFS